MKILNRIKKILPSYFHKSDYDEQFYSELFINNPFWNRPYPNQEEQKRWEIIKDFLGQIHKNNVFESSNFKILDVGCGRGWLTNLLSEYGDARGIEPIKSVVEYGRKLFPKLRLDSGYLSNLLKQEPGKVYDLLVVSEVIEHIPDDSKISFVQELSELAKKEGFLIVSTPRKEAESEWLKYVDPSQPIEDWMTEREVEDLFKALNFKVLDVQRFSISPVSDVAEIEIYQLWLFKKSNA